MLKVQLLLKEFFILAVTNIHVRYDECSCVYLRYLTITKTVRMGALIRTGSRYVYPEQIKRNITAILILPCNNANIAFLFILQSHYEDIYRSKLCHPRHLGFFMRAKPGETPRPQGLLCFSKWRAAILKIVAEKTLGTRLPGREQNTVGRWEG